MAEANDIFAFRHVGLLGDLLCLLQLTIGFPMRLDLIHQQPRMFTCLVLGKIAAFLSKYEQPDNDARDDEDDDEQLPQHRGDLGRGHGLVEAALKVDEPENQPDQCGDDRQNRDITGKTALKESGKAARQEGDGKASDLLHQTSVGLAGVYAARIQRAAERAYRPRIDRATRHILAVEVVLADTTLDRLPAFPICRRLSGDVVATTGRKGQNRGEEKG
ncbi:hypothetical protein D3C73_1081080 [compost metagenome]